MKTSKRFGDCPETDREPRMYKPRKHKALMEAVTRKPEPCVVETENIKPEDCICDVHALEAWLQDGGSPRAKMSRAEQER